jgi:hypothetical protein
VSECGLCLSAVCVRVRSVSECCLCLSAVYRGRFIAPAVCTVVHKVIEVIDGDGCYKLCKLYTDRRKIPKYILQLLQEALGMEKKLC